MIKVKATITTDVEMHLNCSIEDSKEMRRILLETLAKKGYSNNEIKYIKADVIPDEEVDFIEESEYMTGPSRHFHGGGHP